jgi:NADH:ubiquinone oxidoreductase subunit 5 (subunit L)/multisubunit Na+/H+ antiporter MnhA subunit
MEQFINLFIILPFVGFLVSLIIPRKNENLLSIISFSTVGIQLFAAFIFVFVWIYNGAHVINLKEFSIFKAKDYDFYIDFYFDRITLTYLLIGALLTFIVTIYSRYYLHREEGYKRFFNVILFFYLGYNIAIFSGNLETLFIGWEILGISSFLLIAFYRDRYLPVKNAVKVFSIYRIGDVGIILAMWLSHHLWHENISFFKLNNYELVHEHLAGHSLLGFAISMMIFISAAAKSAQLPFSSWLPRAMEGPTPSSAIFYGSLSVHIGAFILMRTYPFWEAQTSFRVFVIVVGLLTAIVATFTARVQSSIKSQVAYSSIAQIGLIFIEIALGLETIALVHVAGNAFLRTYQLLVSPSVVAYKIREQFYNYIPRIKTIEDTWPKRFEYSLYILSLKEWNLDSLMYKYMWNPLKRLGGKWSFLSFKNVYIFFAISFLIGLFFTINPSFVSAKWKHYFPLIFGFIGLLMVIKAFTERASVRLSWSLIITNHLGIALAISFNEHFDVSHHIWYLSGVLFSGIVGYICIQRLRNLENWVSLDKFYGHSYEHPKIALVFLMACLGIAGFPITPTFIGEDLIFSHIHQDQILLAFFVSLSLIINGLAAIRIYARIFLGPHVKTYHGVAKRSS